MKKLPKIIVGVIWITLFSLSPGDTSAVTIATEDQVWSDQLSVWQTIQELGNNLTGTASSFTFRVSTSRTNLNQFDYTTINSKIYDRTTNTIVIPFGCLPPGNNPNDPLEGLTFTTSGVPAGYEDVTIDFSCRNYNFIPGHRYLIFITNANIGNQGSGKILFAAVAYGLGGHGGSDQFTGGGLRYAFNNRLCNASQYVWNDPTQTPASGCNIFTTTKDDLYFVLSNNSPPPPPPRLPVIFIPGIGGSEMKTSQDIVWSKDDGHGGTFSHAYSGNEKIWVNQDKATELGDDDYFDILRLKTDGQTPEADLSLTGNLTSFGYSDIDSFFTGMGYVKGTNFFIFPYDWRKDVRSTKDSLDALIETAKTASGQPKVNLVVHSLGGLVARFYISDAAKAAKVNKLIELGVPHLGSVDSLKAILYGTWLANDYYLFKLGIPPSETYDLSQNSPSVFQMLPSKEFYNFYDNSDPRYPFPFRDDRDIDNNQITGSLNFDQTKALVKNLSHNMTVFDFGEQFHNSLDPILNTSNEVKIYEIVGSGKDTLGQIKETWLIQWPINIIPIQDEIKIDGDGTVPTYSASLKNNSKDLSGGAKIYYVKQKHEDMPRSAGVSMQTVKSILNDDNSLPVEVKDEKINLDGQHVSVYSADLDLYDDSGNHTGLDSNGEVETKIPNTSYNKSSKSTHVFIDKSASKVTAKIKSSKATKAKIKIRNYSQDSIIKTILYNDVPVTGSSTIQFTIDPGSSDTPTLSDGTQTISATTETTGDSALDQTSPTTSIQISGTKDASGIYPDPVTITLTGNDSESGILKIEYSLDDGQTVQTYTEPFIISASGKTTIQFKSIDNLGNEEIPQSLIIEIAVPPTPTPTPSSSSSTNTTTTNTSEVSSTTIANTTSPVIARSEATKQSQDSITSTSAVLGTTFQNPSHISDQINVTGLLDKQKKLTSSQAGPVKQTLSGLLIVSGGIITLAVFGLITTFLKPTPK